MNTKLGCYCTSADLEDTNESLKTSQDNESKAFAMQVWRWLHFINNTGLDNISGVLGAVPTQSREKNMSIIYEVAISYESVPCDLYRNVRVLRKKHKHEGSPLKPIHQWCVGRWYENVQIHMN